MSQLRTKYNAYLLMVTIGLLQGCYSSIPNYEKNEYQRKIVDKFILIPYLNNSCNDLTRIKRSSDNNLDAEMEVEIMMKIQSQCPKALVFGDKIPRNLPKRRIKRLFSANYVSDGVAHYVHDTSLVDLPVGTTWNLKNIEVEVFENADVRAYYPELEYSLQFGCVNIETNQDGEDVSYSVEGSYVLWDMIKDVYVIEGFIGPRKTTSMSELTDDIAAYVRIGLSDLCK